MRRLGHIFKSCLAIVNTDIPKFDIPNIWGIARVAFLSKPGKSDYDLSQIFQTYQDIQEHDLVERLVQTLECISSGRSMETALHHLVGVVEGALQKKSRSYF